MLDTPVIELQMPDGSRAGYPKTALEWWRGNAWRDRMEAQWDSYNKPYRHWIIGHLGESKSLYEIGCGVGANLRLLREKRPDIRLGASDGVMEYCAWVAQEFHMPVEHEVLPWITAPRGPWDTLLVNYVLSYLPPEQALKCMQEIAGATKRVMIIEPAPTTERPAGITGSGGIMDGGISCMQWCHEWPTWAEKLGWIWRHATRIDHPTMNLAMVFEIPT